MMELESVRDKRSPTAASLHIKSEIASCSAHTTLAICPPIKKKLYVRPETHIFDTLLIYVTDRIEYNKIKLKKNKKYTADLPKKKEGDFHMEPKKRRNT